MQASIKELNYLNKESRHNMQTFKTLTMRVQGTVDAAVMGGIKNYQDAFCTPEFIENNPDQEIYVKQLKDLMSELVDVLKESLAVFKETMTADLQGLYGALMEKYKSMRRSIRDSGSSTDSSSISSRPNSSDVSLGKSRNSMDSAIGMGEYPAEGAHDVDLMRADPAEPTMTLSPSDPSLSPLKTKGYVSSKRPTIFKKNSDSGFHEPPTPPRKMSVPDIHLGLEQPPPTFPRKTSIPQAEETPPPLAEKRRDTIINAHSSPVRRIAPSDRIVQSLYHPPISISESVGSAPQLTPVRVNPATPSFPPVREGATAPPLPPKKSNSFSAKGPQIPPRPQSRKPSNAE